MCLCARRKSSRGGLRRAIERCPSVQPRRTLKLLTARTFRIRPWCGASAAADCGCAMPENSRPNPTTKLRVAPYFNVSAEDGLTCQGTMRSPEDAGVATIPLWKRAFFQKRIHASDRCSAAHGPSGWFPGAMGEPGGKPCVWQVILAHFGSLFWPTLRGEGFRPGRKAGPA